MPSEYSCERKGTLLFSLPIPSAIVTDIKCGEQALHKNDRRALGARLLNYHFVEKMRGLTLSESQAQSCQCLWLPPFRTSKEDVPNIVE